MDHIRDEIARVSAEHDKLMAEDQQWLARRNAERRPPVSETPPTGILYRDYGGGAALPAPQPGSALSNGDYAVGHDQVARALGTIHANLHAAFDDEIELLHQLVNLAQVEVNKLRGEFRTATMKLKRELSTMGREIEADRTNGIEVYCAGLERRVAVLEAENIKLKAKLATRAAENAQPRGKRLDQNDDKVKELAAELERERKDREALFDAFETRFSELGAFVRGTVHDWTSA